MSLVVKTVWYKYVPQMAPMKRSVEHFLEKVAEKYKEFVEKKIELHVSPFYISSKGDLVYQPVFDFEHGYDEPRRFAQILMQLHKHKEWIAEPSGKSVHLVCHVAYGPIRSKQHVAELRAIVRNNLKPHFANLDYATSVRILPVRRCPSVSSTKKFVMRPLALEEFLGVNMRKLLEDWEKTPPTEKEFRWILRYHTLPTKLDDIDRFVKLIEQIAKLA